MRFRTFIVYVGLATIAALGSATAADFAVTPLNNLDIGVTLTGNISAATNPVQLPVTGGNITTLFHTGNAVKVDNEYLLITAVTPSNLTATRAQLGSVPADHTTNTLVLRVYQLDVTVASPNVAIGAYQLNVSYDSAKLAITSANVFSGSGPLGIPVAVNTSNPGVVTVNSFNADQLFQGAATPVTRLYFTGSAPGTASVSVALTSVADTGGNDLNFGAAGVTTGLGAASLNVTPVNIVLKKVRGQITSQ